MSKIEYYKKGHITVFLSLVLTLILSVVCTTIESARLQGVKMQIQNLTDMGIYSAFAEYNKDLLEIYDLFFLDMGYGTSDGSKERVNARIKDFVDYNIDVTKDIEALSLLPAANLWRINVDNISTDKYVLSTDNKGKAYYSQAISYMKSKLGISLIESLVDQYDSSIMDHQSTFESEKEKESSIESQINAEKEEYQARYDAALEEAEGDESKVEMEKPTSASNPVDVIKGIQASPILELVVEDSSSISNKKINNFDEVASKRQLKRGSGTFQGESNSAINKALFNEYIFEKFPNYLTSDSDNDHGLEYQAEYILCGKNSDKKNLESVANKLLLIREGINFIYLLSDAAKRQEITLLATTIVGYLGPIAVALLTTVIMLAWAFAESILEVRMLLSGKKVALIKNSTNWNLGLSNLANLSEMLDSGEEDEDGIDYEGYLKLLMFFANTDKKVTRSLDLIELTIQGSNNNFRIDNCAQSFITTANYDAGGLFLRLPFKTIERGNQSYSYSVTKEFSYY